MLHYRVVAKTNLAKLTNVLLGIFGLVGMVYTTVLTVSSWINGGGKEAAPGYCDGR